MKRATDVPASVAMHKSIPIRGSAHPKEVRPPWLCGLKGGLTFYFPTA